MDDKRMTEVLLGRTDDPDPEALDLPTISEGNFPRPANKQIPRLHVRKNDGTVCSFMYHQLDSNAVFKGDTFTLLFAGAKHWEVRVKGCGQNFWKVFDYITLHRWPYVVEAARSFKAGDDDTVFEEIKVVDVTPKAG